MTKPSSFCNCVKFDDGTKARIARMMSAGIVIKIALNIFFIKPHIRKAGRPFCLPAKD